jgi:transcriptional regulator with GAF, ATPase, and Fis domain
MVGGDESEVESLRRQLAIFHALYDLGRGFQVKRDLEEILGEIPRFAHERIGCARTVVLLDDRQLGTFTVRAYDGYEGDEWPLRLRFVRVGMSDALPALVHARKRLVHRGDDPDLVEIGGALAMDSFVACPLYGGRNDLVGILIGSGPLDEDALANLAALASSTIGNWLLYRELAEERNLLEAKVAQRTSELEGAVRSLEEKGHIITQDLMQAREFQRCILAAPPRVPELRIDALYRPLDLVGGDLYDVCVLREGHVRVFVADATGHGVKASLTTMLFKSE